jgi:putative membrane protein insertion efficiency factor
MRRIIIAPFLVLIYLYKYLLSPLLPGGCRHFPSCSTYAIEALKTHGLFRGFYLGAARIGRCHPWGTSGYDPVPRFFFRKINLKTYSGEKHTFPSCDRLKQV